MSEYERTNAKVSELKLSVSEEVVGAQRALLDRVNKTEDRMRNILGAVMVSEYPCQSNPTTDVETEWPPLFSELRTIVQATNDTLDRIDVLLGRVRI